MNSQPRIDLLAPAVRHDPFPYYQQLREQAAACQVDPGGLWVLTRHADVVQALHTPETYSSRGFRAALAPPWLHDERLASLLIARDPPDHTGLRSLVNRIFDRALLARLEPALRGLVGRLCDALEAAKESDVVAELATPVAAGAVAMVLDIDGSEHRRFKHWVDAIGSITPYEPAPATAATIRAAIQDEDDYFRALIAERRERPGDDVLSQLLQSELDGRPLQTSEVVAFAALLLGAGIDTTIHLIAKALLLLSERSDLLARLRGEPARIPDFIEEMLRYDPPTHGLLRSTTQEVRLEGATIPKDSFVMLLLAAANRDPRQYEQPDTFVLERKPRGSLAFGHGPHLCIGAALARLEAKLTLEILLERFADIQRDDSAPISWDRTLHTRGPTRLPLRFVRA